MADDVDDAWREAGGDEEGGKDVLGAGGVLGGFDDDGVAGCESV